MLKHGEWCWLDDGKGNRVRVIADAEQEPGRVSCEHGSYRIQDATTCPQCLSGQEGTRASVASILKQYSFAMMPAAVWRREMSPGEESYWACREAISRIGKIVGMDT